MTQSGNIVYGYSDPDSIAQASAHTVNVTVVVTGADGISRTYTDSTYISKAVPVFDATPNSFALGGVARNGSDKYFDCYMNMCIGLGDCTVTDSGTTLSVTSGASTLDGLVAQSIIDTFSYADAKEILEM